MLTLAALIFSFSDRSSKFVLRNFADIGNSAEVMHCANLCFTGAQPIAQCVSSGLFILSQKVEVKSRHANALCIIKSGPSSFNTSKVDMIFPPGIPNICLTFCCIRLRTNNCAAVCGLFFAVTVVLR